MHWFGSAITMNIQKSLMRSGENSKLEMTFWSRRRKGLKIFLHKMTCKGVENIVKEYSVQYNMIYESDSYIRFYIREPKSNFLTLNYVLYFCMI